MMSIKMLSDETVKFFNEQNTKPHRVQRKRTKGWKMPANTVFVGRPSLYGNPFIVNPFVTPGSKSGADKICVPTLQDAVDCYSLMIFELGNIMTDKIRTELKGKNLACWCKPGELCHADVLLEIANA